MLRLNNPTSFLERKKNGKRFRKRGLHQLEREAVVLRASRKRAPFLAGKMQSACFLFDSFSFARAKEIRMSKQFLLTFLISKSYD
ncbi:MAG: hypothetical protein Q4D30_06425 [Bacteroidales bacterium]|nr:hypothetical protein [Bacteroidales bacterium]